MAQFPREILDVGDSHWECPVISMPKAQKQLVERNALRAKLVKSAGRWPWSSLAKRDEKTPPPWLLPMKQWPIDAPAE
jgi:hypothetical protein